MEHTLQILSQIKIDLAKFQTGLDELRDDLERNATFWVTSPKAERERMWIVTYGWPHGGTQDTPAVSYPRGALLHDSDYAAWHIWCKQRDAAFQLPTINLV